MWKLEQLYERPIEKSIITVFGAEFTSKEYRPFNEFALQETSFRLNAAFLLLLSYWLFQEFWLRSVLDANVHAVLFRAFTVASVLIGSFVTAYWFQLVVVHWPSMRKKYNQRKKIEIYIASILLHWHDLNIQLLGSHERIPEETGTYYENWYPQNARQIHKLMVSRWDGGKHLGSVDPFRRNFYKRRESMREAASKLLEHEDDLPGDFYSAIGIGMSLFDDNSLTIRDKYDEDTRLYELYELTQVVSMYFRVAYRTVLSERHITPELEIAIGHNKYHDVWDDVDIMEKRNPRFEKRKDYY